MCENPEYRGIQQDDNYREIMTWITDGGLRYACAKKNDETDAEQLKHGKVDKDGKRSIIIVGAGMSGLAAAYELAQIGHEVSILEIQSRVGGRVKTFREGFHDGLHAEAGAMRLPYNHFLTKHYIELFDIEPRPFQNYNEKGFMYLYGERITMKDWEDDNEYYSTRYWKGWDENLTEDVKEKHEIKGILDYYACTIKEVKDDLGETPTEEKWQEWVEKWSKWSVEDFLRSTESLPGSQSDEKPKLRPWPEAAIEGYKVSTYTPMFSQDLASYLREELGEWWMDPLYTPTDGMDTLPKGFVKKNKNGWNKKVYLSKNITFGVMVKKVETTKDGRVNVTGENRTTGKEMVYSGDAVILTVPLTILRQLEIPSLSMEQQKALASVTYGVSTKIVLQCKSRFWEKDVGYGGFSKTNLPIGQLHYPSDKCVTEDDKLHYPDADECVIGDDKRGILLVYTWEENALMFGAETKELAIRSAVKQISYIHPEIEKEFEVGNVQAWYSDPAAQGAFACLKPFEYMKYMKLLMTPSNNIYLAGEALSWSNGWIQGAIFSGLTQAYYLQSLLEGYPISCDPVTQIRNTPGWRRPVSRP